MPVTRSELMYFAAGVAVGGAVGANWSKIRPLLETLLGPAAGGFQDAYGEILGQCSGQFEALQDPPAEMPSPAVVPPPHSRTRRTRRTAAGSAGSESSRSQKSPHT